MCANQSQQMQSIEMINLSLDLISSLDISSMPKIVTYFSSFLEGREFAIPMETCSAFRKIAENCILPFRQQREGHSREFLRSFGAKDVRELGQPAACYHQISRERISLLLDVK